MVNRVAVFGAGNIGSVEAKDWARVAKVEYIIDINPTAQALANEIGAKFINEDLTQCLDLKKGYIRGLYWKVNENQILREIVDNTNFWSISVPTDFHIYFLILGLYYKKHIFLEKPTTEDVEHTIKIMNRYPNNKIQVNYVERAHPVVLSIIDDIRRSSYKPKYFFNWRGKNLVGITHRGLGGGEGSRILLEDLVHDLSEIDLIKKHVSSAPFSRVQPNIDEIEMLTWKEKNMPYIGDVNTKFRLRFNDGTLCDIRGGFDEDRERRYFIMLDGKTNYTKAYFGQTITRLPGMTPISAVIRGNANIYVLLDQIKRGILDTSDSNLIPLLKNLGATFLNMDKYAMKDKMLDGKPVYGWTPIARMIDNLVHARNNSQLICPIDDAIEIEKIAKKVYYKKGVKYTSD
ncbi:MAG: hypothetical protein DRN66_03435 [Candidatus Nanohalarchaeota archaeon]|nr:MAG: hypothetical protein DRN66_03435 [Candidatus Nanohaloarchaeota archaeon]